MAFWILIKKNLIRFSRKSAKLRIYLFSFFSRLGLGVSKMIFAFLVPAKFRGRTSADRGRLGHGLGAPGASLGGNRDRTRE